VFAFIVRRLFVSIFVLLGSTMLVFLLITWRGNPVAQFATRHPRPPQSEINALSDQMGWNHSVPVRYWDWLTRLIVHGNFGPSIMGNTENIGDDLFSRLGVTVRLVAAAVILALVLGVITGVLSAVRQYTAFDYTTTFFGFLFLAMPTFWFAVLIKQAAIQYNLATGTQTFSTIGQSTPPSLMEGASTWSHITDVAGHMILPTIALALGTYASWSRYTRGSLLETLNADYIRLARAKGLRWRKVLVRHALRNALIPLTTVTALDIGAIFGGAVIIEQVFQWHGMGEFLLTSITNVDVYATLAWLLVTGALIIIFNLIADLLYGVLDPRIRNA
jgi:peptide/nickel transport system permease protein